MTDTFCISYAAYNIIRLNKFIIRKGSFNSKSIFRRSFKVDKRASKNIIAKIGTPALVRTFAGTEGLNLLLIGCENDIDWIFDAWVWFPGSLQCSYSDSSLIWISAFVGFTSTNFHKTYFLQDYIIHIVYIWYLNHSCTVELDSDHIIWLQTLSTV